MKHQPLFYQNGVASTERIVSATGRLRKDAKAQRLRAGEPAIQEKRRKPRMDPARPRGVPLGRNQRWRKSAIAA